MIYPVNSVIHLLNNWGLSGEFVCGYWGVRVYYILYRDKNMIHFISLLILGTKLTYGFFLHSAQVRKHKEKWGWSLGGQLLTNRCILSTQALSCCPCFQECRKGLFVCTSMYFVPRSVPHGVFSPGYLPWQSKWKKNSILSSQMSLSWMPVDRRAPWSTGKVTLISGLDSQIS